MAIKPRDNETFYREVDEELRRDQMAVAVRRWGWAVGLGIVLLLAALAGVIYWRHLGEVRAGERGERLTALLQDIQAGNVKQATPKLDEIAREGSPGYRAAALLTKADIAIQSGDDAAAIAAFKAIAEDEGLAQPYRELALIRQTASEFDTLPPAAVIQRLAPLARAGNPWFGSAAEMVALAHLKQNRPNQAGPIFAALAKDKTLPDSLRSRSRQMAGALGIDAIETTESTGGPAATKEAKQ